MTRLLHITTALALIVLGTLGCSTTSDPVEPYASADEETRIQIDGASLSTEIHQHFSSGQETVPFARIEQDIGEKLSPAVDYQQLARDVHHAVNDVRQRHDLPPYDWADSLAHVARIHSIDMAENNFFGHKNPSGDAVNDRALQLGQRCQRPIDEKRTAIGFGENLAMQSHFTSVRANFSDEARSEVRSLSFQWLPLPSLVESTVQGWMNSDGHRYNMLHEHHQAHGIAVARSADHVLYITQVLC